MKVVIPYTPRKQQAFVHQELDKYRYAVLCCHRRWGKSVMLINHLIKCAMTSRNHQPRYAYLASTYAQAKRISWDYIKQFAGKIPGTKFNETELRCDFPNGARIMLLSSENPDSIRGIYLDGAVIDEAAQVKPSVIDEVITPALSDRKGFLYVVGTPKGMGNLFYDYYQKAQSDDKWFLHVAKASETKLIDQEELDNALKIMGHSKFQQEYESSFIGNIQGSIYGEILSSLEDKRQIARIPYDPAFAVSTSWDLGYNDHNSIIFFQNLGHAIHIIDYYENKNEALPHYVQVLKEKDYVYDNHYAPHDIEVTEFSTGRTRREVAYQLGIKFRVVPKIGLEDGIHSAKMLLPRCYIDVDNCTKFIDALRHYHRKYNEAQRIYNTKPVHSWSSHACDAFRTLAVGIKNFNPMAATRQQQHETNYEVL